MKFLRFIFVFFVILVVFFVFVFGSFFSSPGGSSTLKRFIVPEGATANQIGTELQKDGLIKNALVFKIYTRFTGADNQIKPGSYDLSSNMSLPAIVSKLLFGPSEIWVTIPEGLRREEIVEKFIENFELKGSQADSFNKTFLALTVSKEGYLFPDTYLFARNATPIQIVAAMESNFDEKYATIEKQKLPNLTKSDVVILASIVQREAISFSDMQGVASVLLNRLDSGMTLGSDVTLEYALGKQIDGSWWKKDLTADDLLLSNPYNTRINAGLPPTAISNPGLDALSAAINPPHTNYLYYLSDSDGKLHFAQTLDEHNANIAKYLQ